MNDKIFKNKLKSRIYVYKSNIKRKDVIHGRIYF